MSIKEATGYSFLFAVLSGFVIELLRMSEQLRASNDWGKFALAILGALACFAVLVACVKGIYDSKNKEKNGVTEEEQSEIRSRPSKGKRRGKDNQ